MKRLIGLAALAVALCVPAAFGQSRRDSSNETPANLYITSMYAVEVYLNNQVVDVLPPGKRTKIMRSKGHWIYVQYQRGDEVLEGWIKR